MQLDHWVIDGSSALTLGLRSDFACAVPIPSVAVTCHPPCPRPFIGPTPAVAPPQPTGHTSNCDLGAQPVPVRHIINIITVLRALAEGRIRWAFWPPGTDVATIEAHQPFPGAGIFVGHDREDGAHGLFDVDDGHGNGDGEGGEESEEDEEGDGHEHEHEHEHEHDHDSEDEEESDGEEGESDEEEEDEEDADAEESHDAGAPRGRTDAQKRRSQLGGRFGALVEDQDSDGDGDGEDEDEDEE
ncbi:hypothetical protein C8Q70DRAFT_1058611 [Cubamyces menziesii]|nr:hypothetical protein C8Q70DRAFT_1058611 [Cubamyces menziesii]